MGNSSITLFEKLRHCWSMVDTGAGFITCRYRYRDEVYNVYLSQLRRVHPIHAHSGSFYSHVLAGSLEQQLFNEKLELMCTMTLAAGSKYYIHKDQKHRVKSRFCITRLIHADEKRTTIKTIDDVLPTGKVVSVYQFEKLWRSNAPKQLLTI